MFNQCIMNIPLSPARLPLALGLLFLPLLAAPVLAEEIFAEDFDGAAGEVIDGRSAGKSEWVASSAEVVLDGAGHAVMDGEGKQSGWISRALPELREGDVITLHARLKPRSPWRGWIGIGFTRNPGSMYHPISRS